MKYRAHLTISFPCEERDAEFLKAIVNHWTSRYSGDYPQGWPSHWQFHKIDISEGDTIIDTWSEDDDTRK